MERYGIPRSYKSGILALAPGDIMAFPSNFVWGAATAAYQIEGSASVDCRTPSVWDTFAERPGKVYGDQTGETACDHYRRFKEDVALMKELGLKAYRFSVSWSRILPEGRGKINQKGIDFYVNLVDELLAAGIEPWLTLYHWDMPQCLQREGGWLNPATGDAFAELTRALASALGNRVKYWMTLNEPQCFVALGHYAGLHAPALTLGDDDIAKVIHYVLVAHGKAVKALREIGGDRYKIGFVPTTRAIIPATESAADIEACRELLFSFNPPPNSMWTFAAFVDPVLLGEYPSDYLARMEPHLPRGWRDDLPLISQKLDFCGVNLYAGELFEKTPDGVRMVPPVPGAPQSALKWPVQPATLRWVPRFMWERYKLPIVIAENGLALPDWVSLDGKAHDPARIDFTWRYLLELEKAIADGAEIAGYFHWSFMDNFEWAEGYKERFGLVHVDFETQKRTPKDSAFWYRTVMETNGDSLHEKP